MVALSAEKITEELCKEWGLNLGQVADIIIELHPASAACATIKYYLGSKEVSILKTYNLVERGNKVGA